MGTDDAVQALATAINGRLDSIESTEARRHEQVVKRLDAISLNGDAPALRQLAKATPALLVVAEHAPALARMANDAEDSRAGWRWLRRRVYWDQGVGNVVKLTVAGLIAALTLFFVAHNWPTTSNTPSIPPSLPQVTAPSTPHASATP